MSEMLDKLASVEARYDEVMTRLADPALQSDPNEFRKLSKALSEMEELNGKAREYRALLKHLDGARELASGADADMATLAKDEVRELEEREAALLADIKVLLLPKDPTTRRTCCSRSRGHGRNEAGLFAAELFRMYSRFAETQGWKLEVMSESPGAVGATRKSSRRSRGRASTAASSTRAASTACSACRHRGQWTDPHVHGHRRRTAEAEEVDIHIEAKDLRVEHVLLERAWRPERQHDVLAVRVTHIPTGIVVSQQDEKSQIKNRAKAMKVLRARLYEMEMRKQQEAIAKDRRSQVGTGERSEKIRTYNFPQSRITDHRINFTTHQLTGVLNGGLEEMLEHVVSHFTAERLKEATATGSRHERAPASAASVTRAEPRSALVSPVMR